MKKLIEQAQKSSGQEKTQKIIEIINKIKENNERSHQFYLDIIKRNKNENI